MRNVERAKKIAADKGINISFVCREIGKSRGYISQMLTTDRDFPDELLLPVANALGVTVEELTGESEKKEKPNALDGVGLGGLLPRNQRSWKKPGKFLIAWMQINSMLPC